jgi:hypothetical protein
MKFGAVEDHGNSYTFIWIIFFDRALEYGDGAKFLGYVGINANTLCTILWFCAMS